MNEIDTAAFKLRTAIRLLIRRAHRDSGEGIPTRSEQGVMSWLDEKGEMTPAALASIEKVRPQTIGQTLDSLDKRRWIKRTPHPTDRRQTLISLSPSGRKTLLKLREMRQSWLVDEFKKLDAKELHTLITAIDILDRIAQS